MAYRTIAQTGPSELFQDRAAATSSIYPGMLVEINSSGTMQLHSTEGGDAEKAVMCEDALQGDTVADVSTAGAFLPYRVFGSGGQAAVLLASGEDVSIGTKLMSGGDGTFKARTSTNKVLAVAMEAKDLSASGASNTLILARFV